MRTHTRYQCLTDQKIEKNTIQYVKQSNEINKPLEERQQFTFFQTFE